MPFLDRTTAGKELGDVLYALHGNEQVNVYGLPRGGIVVAREVSSILKSSLDMVNIRKIGHPYYAEYAIGAVSDENDTVLNIEIALDLPEQRLQTTVEKARQEVERRKKLYFSSSYKPSNVSGQTTILIDDGMATGYTMEAAVKAIKKRNPKILVVAIPVASVDAVAHIAKFVDEVVILEDPYLFRQSVGQHYNNYPQVTDQQVLKILRQSKPVEQQL